MSINAIDKFFAKNGIQVSTTITSKLSYFTHKFLFFRLFSIFIKINTQNFTTWSQIHKEKEWRFLKAQKGKSRDRKIKTKEKNYHGVYLWTRIHKNPRHKKLPESGFTIFCCCLFTKKSPNFDNWAESKLKVYFESEG